jgi:hypothetical protein
LFNDPIPQEYATMQEVTTTRLAFPSTSRDVLSEILREGAQQMLTAAIEAEVAGWIDAHEHLRDERGHRQVVRNGYLPERSITTGIGPVKIRQPRVHDRRNKDEAESVFLEDSSALFTEDSQHRGAAALALPQGNFDGRLQRSASGVGGSRVPRPLGLNDKSPLGRLAGRIP